MRPRVVCVVLVATSLLAASCTRGQPAPPSAAPPTAGQAMAAPQFELGGGARLLAPPGAFDERAEVTGLVGGALPGPSSMPSAGSVEVRSNQQPGVPVIVEIPVRRASFAKLPSSVDDRVPVLHQHEGRPSEPLLGKLDRARAVVSVETRALSVFDVRLPSTERLRNEIGKMLNGILGGVGFKADPPNCEKEQAARSAGWSVASSSSSVVRWCLGLNSDGTAALKLVDNRRYPLLAAHGKATTVRRNTGGEIPVALAQSFTAALEGDRKVTLSPGGTTEMTVRLADGQKTSVVADFDGLAQALVSLQVAAEVMLLLAQEMKAIKPGVKNVKGALETLDAAECVPKLLNLAVDPSDTGRVGAMVSACLKPDDIFTGLTHTLAEIVVTFLSSFFGVIAYFWEAAAP